VENGNEGEKRVRRKKADAEVEEAPPAKRPRGRPRKTQPVDGTPVDGSPVEEDTIIAEPRRRPKRSDIKVGHGV
jgi:hypothetical protein